MNDLSGKSILVLGGTVFIGKVIVEELLRAGARPVLCNRGKTAPGAFDGLELVKLDREAEDPAVLFQRDWDAVIDVSSYYPNSLGNLLAGFKGKVGRYIYISTGSVYRIGEDSAPYSEDMSMVSYTKEERTDDSMLTYGKRKAACEDELTNADIDTLILRPSVVYGRYDHYDRHYYWIKRVMGEAPILLPQLDGFHNYTYVDELANMVIAGITMTEHRKVYNAATHRPLQLHQMLQEMTDRKLPQLVRPSLEELAEKAKDGMQKIPLLFGGIELQLSTKRAFEDFGSYINFQDFGDSIKSTAEWYESEGWPTMKRWLTLEEESELIAQFT